MLRRTIGTKKLSFLRNYISAYTYVLPLHPRVKILSKNYSKIKYRFNIRLFLCNFNLYIHSFLYLWSANLLYNRPIETELLISVFRNREPCPDTGCSLNIVFFLKMLRFFWTLPVLLKCLTCHRVHTLTPRGNRETPESGIYFKTFTLYVIYHLTQPVSYFPLNHWRTCW